MDLIAIQDKKKQLMFALDDIRAIHSVILTIGDHEEYTNAYEALKVIDRALISITDDIQDAIDGIGVALVKENVQQE